ncbi:unnamed protein product, partial [Gongylonema pulchrum]|uniref:Uncharacterized protein n=1 Tax=Gongylonema pulchrum TaxID=637853 RepID=A0A183DDU5_9BILA
MTTYWLTSRKNTVFTIKNECELLLDEKLAPDIFPRNSLRNRLSSSAISKGSSISLVGKEPSLLRRIIERATAFRESTQALHNGFIAVNSDNNSVSSKLKLTANAATAAAPTSASVDEDNLH